jgi:HlyD family secretion protein
VQNVVTYTTIIGVNNPGQRLMPGMTATVSVVVQRRDDVLRIPAAALRFRPEGFDAGAVRERAAGRANGGAGASPEGGGRREGARGATVFTLDAGGEPQPVRIRQGISDGQYVEVVDGLTEGATVITGVAAADAPRAPGRAGGSPAANPFQPTRPQRRTR